MVDYLKVVAGVIVALFLSIVLAKKDGNFSVAINVIVSCTALTVAGSYLAPVLNYIHELEQLANIDTQYIDILLKSVGIGLLTEITAMICSDAGNSSMGKSLQVLAAIVVIHMALPLFTSFIQIVEEILIAL